MQSAIFVFATLLVAAYGQTGNSKCLQEKQKAEADANSNGARRIGGFVPKCEANGSYSKVQSSGSTGYSWCVDENGKKTGEQRAPGSNTRLSCEPAGNASGNKASKCIQERNKAMAAANSRPGMVGGFTPSCEADGTYSPMQFHGSTGMVRCYTPEGVQVESARGLKGCKCLLEKHQANADSDTGMVGGLNPNCEADGTYSKLQFSGSSGYSWCVNENGEKTGEDRAPGSDTKLSCESADNGNASGSKASKCIEEQNKQTAAENAMPGLVGGFTPKCEADGTYSLMQFHGSTGMIRCYTPEGVQVASARGLKACKCLLEKHQANANSDAGMIGGPSPNCEADGTYSKLQFSGSSGYSWCVDENGEKTGEERAPASNTRLSCERASNANASGNKASKCIQERNKAMAAANAMPGMVGGSMPKCEADGSYSKRQSSGSTGYTWCVDKNGEKTGEQRAPGTRVKLSCD